MRESATSCARCAVRALGEVSVDVTDHLAHVRVVVVGELGLVLAEQTDDVAAGLVADGFGGV
jgi:hypothetical protein